MIEYINTHLWAQIASFITVVLFAYGIKRLADKGRK